MIAAVRWVGELLDELVSGSAVSVRVSPDIREPSDWLAWRLIPEAFAGLRVPRHTQLGKMLRASVEPSVFCRVLYVVTCLMWSSSAARTLPREPQHNQAQSNAIKRNQGAAQHRHQAPIKP